MEVCSEYGDRFVPFSPSASPGSVPLIREQMKLVNGP